MPDNGNPNDRSTVLVGGSNFRDRAAAGFGDRISVQDVTFNSGEELAVRVKIQRRAALGPRTVTVTNPDTGSHSLPACFIVN